MPIKLALPKGQLLRGTATLLERAELGITSYHEGTRSYRLRSPRFPYLGAKIFQERDIPIQIGVGNYDLGICGSAWVEELLAKYPASKLLKVRDLGYGRGTLHVVASKFGGISKVEELTKSQAEIRIASEYPNLAESFALNLRIKRFNIFPLWGAAEVYPPESADIAIIWESAEDGISAPDLVSIRPLFETSAFLIANKNSWETKDMSEVVTLLCQSVIPEVKTRRAKKPARTPSLHRERDENVVRLALPDGHQQLPMLKFLRKVGIEVDASSFSSGNRRPGISLEGVLVKMIRPQDMPLQVACGNFDLAITGEDWLADHRYRFPSSPVRKVMKLGFGKVKIVAAISQELPVTNVQELKEFMKRAGQLMPLRVASEYVDIADKYARDNHLAPYKVIPTWGASEAFLPEDADLLIENTETGKTLARHNLRIIDTIFESSACLIANTGVLASPAIKEKIDSTIAVLRSGLGGNDENSPGI